MRNSEVPVPGPFDTTLKQLVDLYAADWADFLRPVLGPPAGPVAPLDADLSTVSTQADKVAIAW
jgi:hypothetical protein